MAGPTQKLYGETLPDQVDRISALSDAQLGLLTDIREVFKERAALEKEYSTKLAALAKRAADKKTKRISSLVVGDDPSVAWGEDTIRLSSLDRAYGQFINSLENTALDHSSLSDVLITQVSDATKALEKKHESMKTKQYQFYEKVLTERDRIYADRAKAKIKYDEDCLEVEGYRKKQDKSQDDKHAVRAAKQFETQMTDMQNSKNSFIIATAIANREKDRFFNEDLPLIENDFQRLQTSLVSGLLSILTLAQSLHLTHLSSLQSRITTVQDSLALVNTTTDQNLFIQYNTRVFHVPGDWAWEPCAGYYDAGDMALDPAPKVFLQNKLAKGRGKMEEVAGLLDGKKKEVDKLTKIIDTYMQDRSLGAIEDIMNDYLSVQHQLTPLEVSATILQAEIDTISGALDGDEGSQNPHSFKSTSFSIPTTCGYCKSSIWGLSKQGKTCKTCGLCVHTKCELKVPASCGGSRSSNRVVSGGASSSLSRTDSRASSISTSSRNTTPMSSVFPRHPTIPDESASTPSPSSPAFPQPSHQSQTHLSARLLYDFTATSSFELTVSAGSVVPVLEEDDGSGWVKVGAPDGRGEGLVPASYVEVFEAEVKEEVVERPKKPPPAVPSRTKPKVSLGNGQYVKGLYTYQASGPGELDVAEGAMYELSSGTGGGQYYADGWWEGYDSSGKKGIFPSNYVELV